MVATVHAVIQPRSNLVQSANVSAKGVSIHAACFTSLPIVQ